MHFLEFSLTCILTPFFFCYAKLEKRAWAPLHVWWNSHWPIHTARFDVLSININPLYKADPIPNIHQNDFNFIMADEGAGIWGASIDDDGIGHSKDIGISESSERPASLERRESKPAPRLFDDLGDAGWGSPDGDQPSFDKQPPVTPAAPSHSQEDAEFEDALT